MRCFLLLLLSFFILCKCNASSYKYEYDTNCAKAYAYFTALHIQDGNSIIEAALRSEPTNLLVSYIADYDDCLSLIFNPDPAEYERRKAHFEQRLSLLDKGDENSPWYRFCKAGLYFHWALVYFRQGENVKAAIAFRKSYLLVKENEKKFPAFIYNNVFAGVGEALAGAIPDSYKWFASIFGIKGSIRKGGDLLSAFIIIHTDKDFLYTEAVIYRTYLLFYLLQQKEIAWQYLNTEHFSVENNLFNAFVKSNIALNYKKADIAIQTLKIAERSKDYDQLPMLDYQMAYGLLYKQDTGCLYYFQRFLKHNKGKDFIKDTWQIMALEYYVLGKMPNARYCREQINKVGRTQVDVDKQAQRFYQTSHWPARELVQARMLIEGGYFEQALDVLLKTDYKGYHNIADKLEYSFRMGRVYDELGKTDMALQCYSVVIEAGRNRTEYFAARAALQMAFIYEHTGKTKQAIAKYEEVLTMRNHDFQASIDQQAKAGINRLQ